MTKRPRPSRPSRRPAVTRRPLTRKVLAVVLTAVAVGLLARGALAPADPGRPTVVLTRTIPAGDVVRDGDLQITRVPEGARPEGTFEATDEIVGRRVAVPLPARSPVAANHLVGSGLLDGQPAGTVATWLPLPDPHVAQILSPGDRVDVRSPVDGAVVAADALVLQVRVSEEGQGAVLGLPGAASGRLAAAVGADPAGGSMSVDLKSP